MSRLITLIFVAAGVSACASSGTQSQEAGAVAARQDTNVAASTGTAAAAESGQVSEAASGDAAAVDYVEAPQVEQSLTASPKQRDDVICRRERVTGSHRMERVCRSRNETEQTAEATRNALRDASRRTGGSANSN